MNALSPEQIAAYKTGVPKATDNEPMAKHTSFRMGGAARLYVVASSSDELVSAVDHALALNIPFYFFGGGSNILVADEGYEGVIIQAANRKLAVEGEIVRAEAGVISAMVARQSVDAGLTGFEWAVGLPGTIGGAVYGDAGCYGGEMRDSIVSVDAYRIKDRKRVTLTNADCQFGYRESIFKREPHVILGCELKLSVAADPEKSKARLNEILLKRKTDQPLELSSAGSTFKNFEYKNESELEILRREIDEIPEPMLKAKRIAAGWLIEQAGMKGERVGDMEVGQKHANFFVNRGAGRAQDVIALISRVKMKVRDEFGIELHEEVQYVGF